MNNCLSQASSVFKSWVIILHYVELKIISVNEEQQKSVKHVGGRDKSYCVRVRAFAPL